LRHFPYIKTGIFSFDELISLGRKNNMMLGQVKQYVKMKAMKKNYLSL
jgi:hypothetical protein